MGEGYIPCIIFAFVFVYSLAFVGVITNKSSLSLHDAIENQNQIDQKNKKQPTNSNTPMAQQPCLLLLGFGRYSQVSAQKQIWNKEEYSKNFFAKTDIVDLPH